MNDKRFDLHPGMVFATSNPQGIGKPIRWFEKLYAKDRHAQYGHTGIIQDVAGSTFEALWTITESNLFDRYKGSKVLIVQPKVTREEAVTMIDALKEEHLKQIYPAWRLLLHLVPPLARRVSYKGKWVVCSELVAKYLFLIGIRHSSFAGTNPDNLVDEWRKWRDYEIVWEGVL